jgi:GTP cyclohydrolase II
MGCQEIDDLQIKLRQSVRIHIPGGVGQFVSFVGLKENKEHFAVLFGDWKNQESPWVRIHSECITGDLFSSTRCDCGPQLQESIQLLRKNGGILVYLRQEGRGIGLYNKLDAYSLQDQGLDTFEANERLGFKADLRSYSIGADILKCLNKSKVQLISNNPQKAAQLRASGIDVTRTIPTGTFLTSENRKYLEAKVQHSGHVIQGIL